MIGNQCGDAPSTGRAFPDPDDEEAADRAAAIMKKFEDIGIPYGPQKIIASRIRVLHQRSLGMRGSPLPGLRFSQVSQAGKSFVLKSCQADIIRRSALKTGTVNPHLVLYVDLEVRITVKMMCKSLLRQLGDPHSEMGDTDVVRLRTKEFMERRGTELLIVDEAQHLARETNQNADVTDELKRFLDAGIVAVVMAGNEDSRALFERNPQLASRLGVPLELSPVDPRKRTELTDFKTFCRDLDHALFHAGCTRALSDFAGATQVGGLLKASGGHIGRVCRIVEAALEQPSLRNAEFVEPYDLAFAIDTFAIPQGYAKANPFRRIGGGRS